LIGALVREAFAPFTGHPFDFELWIRLGFYTAQGLDPFRVTAPVPHLSMPGAVFMTYLGYPPVWPFVLAALYKLYAVTGINNRFFYYFILKQPMVAGDLIDSLLIYKIVKQASGVKALNALKFWLFCPFTIIISAIWGMFDQLVLVFVLLSMLWISRTKTSALTEAVGFLLKGIPLIYLPIFAFVQNTWRKIALYLISFAAISISFTFLPYLIFPSWKISTLLSTGTSVVGKVGGSMNYWEIFYVLSSSGVSLPAWAEQIIGIASYLWIPALLVSSFYCVRKLRIKKTLDQKLLVLSLTFVTLVFFLTKAQINEQYAIYFLGLGLIDYYWIGSRERTRKFHGIWISALAFLVVNNTLLTRFLEPLSIYYQELDHSLETGVPNEFRLAGLLVTSISFSILCALYLRSVYATIRREYSKEFVPTSEDAVRITKTQQ
jgi:hypothetical protein